VEQTGVAYERCHSRGVSVGVRAANRRNTLRYCALRSARQDTEINWCHVHDVRLEQPLLYLSLAERAARGGLRNFHIFDFAINGVAG
jgi:hypothetical protein